MTYTIRGFRFGFNLAVVDGLACSFTVIYSLILNVKVSIVDNSGFNLAVVDGLTYSFR